MDYVLVDNREKFEKFKNLFNKIKPEEIALDIETDGVDFLVNKILSIQVGFRFEDNILVFVFLGDLLRDLVSFLSNKDIKITGHNLKFDIKFIVYNFLLNAPPVNWSFFDTMLARRLVCIGKSNCPYMAPLSQIVYEELGIELDKEIRDKFEGADNLSEEMLSYAANDVRYLLEIKDILQKKLDDLKIFHVAELEFSILLPVSMMEIYGINIDKEKFLSISMDMLNKYSETRNKILKRLEKKFVDLFGDYSVVEFVENILGIKIKTKKARKSMENLIVRHSIPLIIDMLNLASNLQLLNLFRNVYKIDIKSTSANDIHLYMQEHELNDEVRELFEDILNMRFYLKRYTAFGEKFLESYIHPKTGKIHARFNQLGTSTGRFSSSNPNMQQIPAEEQYRKCFISRGPEYKIITADYSQAELRLMAAVSHETKMIDAYKHDEDLHKKTASIIFNKPEDEIEKHERKLAKSVNFAVIYGTTYKGLQYKLNLPKKTAIDILEKFYKGYPNMAAFIKYARDMIWKKGYSITPFGRKRFFDIPTEFKSSRERDKIWAKVTREGLNHIIQGGSADAMKIAIRNIFYKNPFGHDKLRILLTVHDEVVIEVHESIVDKAVDFIVNTMKESFQRFLGEVPAEVGVKISDSWEK